MASESKQPTVAPGTYHSTFSLYPYLFHTNPLQSMALLKTTLRLVLRLLKSPRWTPEPNVRHDP